MNVHTNLDLTQNSFLRPDIPLLTGLITAKFLSAPRYSAIDGAYYGKILICAPMYKGGGYNRPDFISHTRVCEGRWVYSTWFCLTYPRLRRPMGIFDLILSHIPASVKVGGYNRPDFVSHTRFRKFCWVQIACFWLLYLRQQVLLGTDSLFLNSIPSSASSVGYR